MTLTGWVPLALAADIPAGTSAGAVLDGAEIVAWRDSSGAVHLWEDRCPHRGMKMSFGFVRGDHLACLYHGWEYDGGGLCRRIPAHPDLDVPKSICVTRYQGAEAAGLIWVHAPLEGKAAPPPADEAATPVRSLFLNAPLGAARAALGGPTGAYANVDGPQGPLGIGLQPIGPGASAMHITALGAAGADACLAICDWAEALRSRIETPDAARDAA